MIGSLWEAQVPFVAIVLLAAAAAKAMPRGRGHDRAPILDQHHPFVATVAAAEATLGALMLITPIGVVRLAAVVFFATATSVVAELARRGTREGCGCFGGLSTAPPGPLGVARAVLLTGAAIASSGIPRSGATVLGAAGGRSFLLLAGEFAVFLALSPELAHAVGRARRPAPCELRDVPLAATYATLRASRAWRDHEASLASAEPAEVWRELCHRYLVYPAEVEGQPAEVVFAVPVDGRRPGVRAGVIAVTDRERQDDDSGPQRVHTPA